MNWKFWKREEETSQVDRLQEELTTLNTQMKNISDQVTKLTRVQFKSNKNMEEKIDDFGSTLSDMNRQNNLVAENQRYERQQDFVMQNMIRLLDELDHVSSGIKGSEQVWSELLDQWSRTIMESIEGIGVYQLDVIGKTFSPEFAESMKTVSRESLTTNQVVPYQVVEVLKRGYITENGRLIRKAKVVTIREEGSDGER